MSENNKTVIKFFLMSLGLGVIGIILAVFAILLVRFAVGDDSIAVIGLAMIGAIVGYVAGSILGLLIVQRVFHWRGSFVLGGVLVLVWAVAGFAVTMLFAGIGLNPWIALVLFYATLPFVGLGAYSLKRRR